MTVLLALLLNTLSLTPAHGAELSEEGPTGAQTPCEWLLAHRETGLTLPDQQAMAKEHRELFTRRDIKCLKKAGVHPTVWKAARGESSGAVLLGAIGDAAEAYSEEQRKQEEAEQRRLEAEREHKAELAAQEAEAAEARAKRRAAQQAERIANARAAEQRKQRQDEEELARRVDIELVMAVIAPANSRGQHWDGLANDVDPEVVSGVIDILDGIAPIVDVAGAGGAASVVTSAVSSDDAKAAITFLVNEIGQSNRAPDVYGYAQIFGSSLPAEWRNTKLSLRAPDDTVSNHFDVPFAGTTAYQSVEFNRGDRIQLKFYERDIPDDDDFVGAVDIVHSDVLAALQAEGQIAIITHDRGQGTVLYVTIAARPSGTLEQRINGSTFE